MSRAQEERTEYQSAKDDSTERLTQAYKNVLDGKTTPPNLNLCIYAEPKKEADTEDQTKWKTIQLGLEHNKLDDHSLADFARAVGDYATETRKELKNMVEDRSLADPRDAHLKQLVHASVDIQVLGHALETVVTRSNWYPFPQTADPSDHFEKYRTLGIMAAQDSWDQIPAKVKDLSLEGMTLEKNRGQPGRHNRAIAAPAGITLQLPGPKLVHAGTATRTHCRKPENHYTILRPTPKGDLTDEPHPDLQVPPTDRRNGTEHRPPPAHRPLRHPLLQHLQQVRLSGLLLRP